MMIKYSSHLAEVTTMLLCYVMLCIMFEKYYVTVDTGRYRSRDKNRK